MTKFLSVLAAFFGSTSSIFVKYSTMPSMLLVMYRLIFSTLILTPITLIKNRKDYKDLDKKIILMIIAGGLFLGLHFIAYFESLNYTNIMDAVMLCCTEVFFVAIFERLFLKEKIKPIGYFLLLITFIGCVIVVTGANASGGIDRLKGDILALIASMLAACYTIIGRRVRRTITTNVYTNIVYGVAGLELIILVLVSGIKITGYESINWFCIAGLVIFPTLLGHSLFSFILKYEKASFVTAVKMLSPVFAAIFGFILFDETPSLQIIIGSIIIICGILSFARLNKNKLISR